MNIPLLRQIQQRIVADPDAFRMDVWSCGSAHCIAGWSLVLTEQAIVNPEAPVPDQRTSRGQRIQDAACEVLGIKEEEGDLLFNTCEWPEDFQWEYEEADADDDRPRKAKVAADVIDFFIAEICE